MATPPFLPDETKPGAGDLVSLYPGVEQTFRDVIESWLLVEHNTSGTHKQVTLDDIAEPTIAANLVGLWHESGVLKTRFAAGTVYNILTTNTGLALAGGTMTGLLVLSGNPAVALGAATKQQVDLKAPLAGPTFTGDPKAPTPSAGDNDTSIATTAFVIGEAQKWVIGTVTDISSGTSHPYTSLPANIQSIICMIRFMSLTTGAHPLIQLGTSGGLKTSGYTSKAAGNAQSTGFIVANGGGSGDTMTSVIRFDRLTGNKWVASGSQFGDGSSIALTGEVDLAGELTQLALMNGTFDGAGSEFNIKYIVG